jgi:4-hydroxybenzoate polyprenyltransferase
MIKFSHTIFALPFALTALVLASRGLPEPRVLFWVVVAMAGARTTAMAWNRIADREIDAKNPRTAARHIPSGKVSMLDAWLLTLGGAVLLEIAAWKLNPLCLKLSPVALGAVFLYPFTKRFTALCHYFLGICLAGAPLGAWIAVRGEWKFEIVPLAVAVVVWVAGFDILYALQDLDFDKKEGLKSVPARLGVRGSLLLAKALHIVMMGILLWQIPLFGLGYIYGAGLLVVAALFIYEHSLLKPDDLSKLDAAFFNMNGIISVVVFVSVLLDVLILKGVK